MLLPGASLDQIASPMIRVVRRLEADFLLVVGLVAASIPKPSFPSLTDHSAVFLENLTRTFWIIEDQKEHMVCSKR